MWREVGELARSGLGRPAADRAGVVVGRPVYWPTRVDLRSCANHLQDTSSQSSCLGLQTCTNLHIEHSWRGVAHAASPACHGTDVMERPSHCASRLVERLARISLLLQLSR